MCFRLSYWKPFRTSSDYTFPGIQSKKIAMVLLEGKNNMCKTELYCGAEEVKTSTKPVVEVCQEISYTSKGTSRGWSLKHPQPLNSSLTAWCKIHSHNSLWCFFRGSDPSVMSCTTFCGFVCVQKWCVSKFSLVASGSIGQHLIHSKLLSTFESNEPTGLQDRHVSTAAVPCESIQLPDCVPNVFPFVYVCACRGSV